MIKEFIRKYIITVGLVFGLSVVGYVWFLQNFSGMTTEDIFGPPELEEILLTKTSAGCVRCHGRSEVIGETIETLLGGKEFKGYRVNYKDPHVTIFILGKKESLFIKEVYAAGTAHPVGIVYPIDRVDYVFPPKYPIVIPNGLVQCESCHLPLNENNPEHGKLVMSNNGSALCLGCHIK